MIQYGKDGSTLNDELNRLANGGNTYPPISSYKDRAGAAQAWAANRSIPLGKTTDLVGVINLIAGNSPKSNYLDIAGVCNQIAGTVGLEPAAALRMFEGSPPGTETWSSFNPTTTWNTVSPTITWLAS